MIFMFLRRWHYRSFRGQKVKRPHRLVVWVLAMFCAHILAMMIFENKPFLDAHWLTWTTITTTGYGDDYAKTQIGRLATIAFVYVGGAIAFANLFGAFLDRRNEIFQRKLSGKWRWNLHDHLLIISTFGQESSAYLEKLIREVRANTGWEERPIEILTTCFAEGLPDELKALGVVHYSGNGLTAAELRSVNADKAEVIVVLGNSTEKTGDALVFDVISRCPRETRLIAECADDDNRERLRSVGADAVVRESRGVPELMARAIVAPGSEKVLERLIDSQGEQIITVPLNGVYQATWGRICCDLILADYGTPLGYVNEHGEVVTTPKASDMVLFSSLFLIAHEDDCDKLGRDIVNSFAMTWGNAEPLAA